MGVVFDYRDILDIVDSNIQCVADIYNLSVQHHGRSVFATGKCKSRYFFCVTCFRGFFPEVEHYGEVEIYVYRFPFDCAGSEIVKLHDGIDCRTVKVGRYTLHYSRVTYLAGAVDNESDDDTSLAVFFHRFLGVLQHFAKQPDCTIAG